MALLLSLTSSSPSSSTLVVPNSTVEIRFRDRRFSCPNSCNPRNFSSSPFVFFSNTKRKQKRVHFRPVVVACQLCTTETLTLDASALDFDVAVSEEELLATCCLRVRSFYKFQQSYGIDDHRKYLAKHEFEALKERIAGKREGFRRVSCINVTVPLSRISDASNDLLSTCKFSEKGEDRVVVGTLDLNQCLRLPDEITGKRPEGIGADSTRAYLSNVCVAKELQRNGLGHLLVAKSKKVALDWGITDLYVHVAVDNEPARKLYTKSGFVYENDEPAWQARFLDRPRRLLLWTDLSVTENL